MKRAQSSGAKRPHSPSAEQPPGKRPTKERPAAQSSGTLSAPRPTVFATLDEPRVMKRTLSQTKALLEQVSDESSEQTSTDTDDEEFEDVPIKGLKPALNQPSGSERDMQFLDLLTPSGQQLVTPVSELDPIPSGDLEITLGQHPNVNPPKRTRGGSKEDKTIRKTTHQLHVMFLMLHNSIRNRWLNDIGLQRILIAHMHQKICGAMDTYWQEVRDLEIKHGPAHIPKEDPLMKLLKHIVRWFTLRFTVTASSLQTRGYSSRADLKAEVDAWSADPSDTEAFGERFENKVSFREAATKMQGSRAVGAQLLVALLRGHRFEARMVASLQPIGFGFSIEEERGVTYKRGPGTSTPLEPADSGFSSEYSTGYGSTASPEDQPRSRLEKPPKPGRYTSSVELECPTYWVEVISLITSQPIIVVMHPKPQVLPASKARELKLANIPVCGGERTRKQVLGYVVGFSRDGTAKDLTERYTKGQKLRHRIPPEKVPIYDFHERGKIRCYRKQDWFKGVMALYTRTGAQKKLVDKLEDEGDLKPGNPPAVDAPTQPPDKLPDSIAGFQRSTEYIIPRLLKQDQVIHPDAKPVGDFLPRTRKTDGSAPGKEPVYLRTSVVDCKSVEYWRLDGRTVLADAQPLTQVPLRTSTISRRREQEEFKRATGQKAMQPLFGRHQTELFVHEPVRDGKIVADEHGTIALFKPHMLPTGAVHIKEATAATCKRLGISHAEACVGLEFRRGRAFPVVDGVVVPEGEVEKVLGALEEDEAERIWEKAVEHERLALELWRRFSVGLQLRDRLNREHGEVEGEEDEEDEELALNDTP